MKFAVETRVLKVAPLVSYENFCIARHFVSLIEFSAVSMVLVTAVFRATSTGAVRGAEAPQPHENAHAK